MAFILGKWCAQEGVNNHQRKPRTDHAGTNTKDICVIVFPGCFRGEYIMTERGADAGLFICGHGHADAGTADEDPQFSFAGADQVLSVNSGTKLLP